MNDHQTTDPYDWTTDPDFARVLAQTGEHNPGQSTLPATASAVFTAADLAAVPSLDDLARVTRCPVVYDTPRPGTIEVRTADGRTLWVYINADSDPTNASAPRDAPAPRPFVSRWAVDTALVSLSVSGAAWISALAVGEFAHAAVALAAALVSLCKLALAVAIVLGILAVVKNKAGAVVHKTVNNHITASGLFARARTTGGTSVT